MSDPLLNDPDFRAWAKDVKVNLVPMIENSAIGAALLGEEVSDADVKQAVEIGFILLLGKPLVLVVEPGTMVPNGLAKAAEAIIERDPADPGETGRRIQQVIAEVLKDG